MRKLFIAMCAMIMATSCCNNSSHSCDKECCEQAGNPVIETIISRRSIRKYKDEAVSRELLDKIVECGIHAPNGMNAQQWEVRIVDNPEWLKNVTEAQVKAAAGTPMEKMFADPDMKNAFRNAPAVIFIGHKPGMCTQIDCGLMAGNMVLAAKSLGLGSVCMMGPLVFFSRPEGKPYLEQLGFSEGYELLLCVGVGYADEEPAARPRNKGVIKYVE
ncbi:MAG: nitroreductase [Alistipes sp.]|nr:nitroreductase [Alistipes sp.]